jgi:outer membrane receptor protein involved in Fe transport
MKKALFIISLLASGIFATGVGVWAQEASSNEFTLEEITVTAEKRAVNLQALPSSVVAITGADLADEGKTTVAQILENIPNIRYGAGLESNPDGGIAIRGVQYKRNSDGQPPAATATYVDGVFQGIGGNYDIERVEVLRGPQGTLYGRSATGGVVSFYTKNPSLTGFSGTVTGEVGTASLKNVQAAVNIPLSETFALRVAGRYYERDGFKNPYGAYNSNKDGRIKLLYQPTDALNIILTGSISDKVQNSGGYTARLTSPTDIDYKASVAPVLEGGDIKSTQASLGVNYDFGGSTLAYIGSYRNYKDMDSPGFMMNPPGLLMVALRTNPGEHFYTHELRLASDTKDWWTWLIGANYFKSDYDRAETSVQISTDSNTSANAQNVDMFVQKVSGNIKNFGLFTEETFNLRDDMRLTAGLRYDKTTVLSNSSFAFNTNLDEFMNSLNPATWDAFGVSETHDFKNTTYKLRFEYDVTPNNMLYVLTATGFLPGDVKVGTNTFPTLSYTRILLPEEKLTSYEIGSKNRFLNNMLQVNVSAFYYDYQNYENLVNTASRGQAPNWNTFVTPLKMTGAELSAEWLLTMEDRLSLTAGWLKAKIDGYPVLQGFGDTHQFMALGNLPGLPKFTANLQYDHTFTFGNGSTLVPRAELHYTDGMYVVQMTQAQAIANDQHGSNLPYAYQDSYAIVNLGATWNSPDSKYSLAAYVRNATDKEYKTGVTLNNNASTQNIGVSTGDPRTWGVTFTAKF